MARPLPVTARDILAQVELASGLGLIRDSVTIANDASASLGRKVALFGASAVMTPQDRQRLEGLLVAVEAQQRQTGVLYIPARQPSAALPDAAEVATSESPFAPNGYHRASQNDSQSPPSAE